MCHFFLVIFFFVDFLRAPILILSSIDGVAKSGQVPWLADSDNKSRLRLAGNCHIGEILLKLNRWLLKTSARKTLLNTSKHVESHITCMQVMWLLIQHFALLESYLLDCVKDFNHVLRQRSLQLCHLFQDNWWKTELCYLYFVIFCEKIR